MMEGEHVSNMDTPDKWETAEEWRRKTGGYISEENFDATVEAQENHGCEVYNFSTHYYNDIHAVGIVGSRENVCAVVRELSQKLGISASAEEFVRPYYWKTGKWTARLTAQSEDYWIHFKRTELMGRGFFE